MPFCWTSKLTSSRASVSWYLFVRFLTCITEFMKSFNLAGLWFCSRSTGIGTDKVCDVFGSKPDPACFCKQGLHIPLYEVAATLPEKACVSSAILPSKIEPSTCSAICTNNGLPSSIEATSRPPWSRLINEHAQGQ